MRSIGARLTSYYAFSATLTLAILFFAGYLLLESRLTHGLDELNAAEFRQLQATLGPDYRRLGRDAMNERLREVSELGSVLFYINIHVPESGIQFESHNLHGRHIPDIKGKREFTAEMTGAGPVRVNEFMLPPYDVMIATSAQSMRDGMRAYVKVCVALLVAMLAASAVIGFGLSRVMLRPLRLIRETAQRIGSDNLSERIPVDDIEDELTELARLLNATFDRLESAFDQIRRFSYEASHELKTPLSLIRLHAEKMLSDPDLAPQHVEALVVQVEELARLNHIIDELLFLSRAEAKAVGLQFVRQDPGRFLENFSQDAAVLVEHRGIRFSYAHRGEGEVNFEEKWIRQVLLNILTNALNVSRPGGEVRIRSAITKSAWRISVEDDGPGLTAEQRERAFDRFVRFGVPTEGDRGSGLGLAICRSIIQLHGGLIFAEPGRQRKGLRVVFEIPAHEPTRLRTPATERRAA